MGKLFYGTQTGNTTGVAEQIQAALGTDLVSEVVQIYTAKPDQFAGCDFLVLGGSTWGDGELTDDWVDFWPQMDKIDFTGVKVALFALGDQFGYGHNFVSSMRIMYDKVVARGATVVATQIPNEGFDFSHTESIVDGYFVGLVVDEMNEPEKTPERINVWAEQVKTALGLVAV